VYVAKIYVGKAMPYIFIFFFLENRFSSISIRLLITTLPGQRRTPRLQAPSQSTTAKDVVLEIITGMSGMLLRGQR